jgi:hypothetical protein
MPVEIREIIIRTEITTANSRQLVSGEKEMGILKKKLLEACRAMIIKEFARKNSYKR